MTMETAHAAADDWVIQGCRGKYLITVIDDDLFEIWLRAKNRTRNVGYATSERMVVDRVREYDLED